MAVDPLTDDDAFAAWCEPAFLELRQILYWVWGPLGVSDAYPYTAAEYDEYARELLPMLRAGITETVIVEYLFTQERDTMGSPAAATGEFRDRRADVAERIVSWFDASLEGWETSGYEPSQGFRHEARATRWWQRPRRPPPPRSA